MELLLTLFVGAIACGMVYYAGYHRGVSDTENDEQKRATIKALAERKVDRVMEIPTIRDNPKAQEYIAVKCGAVPFPEADKPVSYTVETRPMTPEEIERYGAMRRDIKEVEIDDDELLELIKEHNIDTLAGKNIIGVEEEEVDGVCIMSVHYTADPAKRSPEWVDKAKRVSHPDAWNREMELKEPNGTTDPEDDAPGGYYRVVNGMMTYFPDKNNIKPPGQVVEPCKTSKK